MLRTLRCEILRALLRCRLVGPIQAFYNRNVTINSTQNNPPDTRSNSGALVEQIRAWALALGFSQIGIANVDLSSAEPGLLAWLAQGFHGGMDYMARHGTLRSRPAELVPGTLSVLTARMDYLPAASAPEWQAQELQGLGQPAQASIALYARGRDYHKVLRSRLQTLAQRIAALGAEQGAGQGTDLAWRVFTDSAPVLEAELATRSGLGWRGKHTLVLDRSAGSLFFLGEIYLNIALPPTPPVSAHCGSCQACIQICPTQAIVAPYRLDARRCIAYLTIEHPGPIPLELRPLMGNRIYGCDDCQLACPWNKFAQRSTLPDFDVRPGLHSPALAPLLDWTEAEFLQRTEGNPIRRIGHERWLRNVAVALGNALRSPKPAAHAQDIEHDITQDIALWRAALQRRAEHPSPLLREHVQWALAQTPTDIPSHAPPP